MAVLFSPAEMAGLSLMSLKRLVVNEATLAQTAISKGLFQVLENVDVDVDVTRLHSIFPRCVREISCRHFSSLEFVYAIRFLCKIAL